MSAPQKLRILCLHGYTSNAFIYQKRCGSLRKSLKCTSILAPVTPASGAQERSVPPRTLHSALT